jgi:ketosteroid isomerase-like protein
MKIYAIMVLAACYVLGVASGSAETAEEVPTNEKVVIEKCIRASIGWALTKDRPLLESVLAQDERLFLFQPDSKSTVIGWEQFVKGFDFWMDPRFKAVQLEIRDLRIDLSRTGDVAWWACILDDLGEWDGRPIGWKDTRWTGVLEKRDGRWLIVQMHFSFAADLVRAAAATTGQQ